MANKPDTLPSRCVRASIGKATLSFILDFAFSAVLAVVLYFTVGNLGILNNNDYYPAVQEESSFVTRSGLIDVKEDGSFNYYIYTDTDTEYAYQKYVDMVWDFFTEKIPSNADFTANVSVSSTGESGGTLPAYAGEARKDNAEYTKWVYVNYFGYVDGSEDNLFAPSVTSDFTSKPAPTGKYADPTVFHEVLLTSMFENGKSRGHYVDACSLVMNQPAFSAIQDRIRMARYAALAPALGIPPIVFFFIIPVILSNGKTLGKLIVGEAVIGQDGYTAPKISIILRQGIITLMLLLLALPWQVVTWPLMVLLLLIGYMSRVLSKTSQPFHDKICRTLCVDAKKSLWFVSPQEEERFLEEHPQSPYAKSVKAEEQEHSMETAVTSAVIEAQERILDLSTINKRREEARNMTSFDEFERQSDADFAAREEEAKKREQEQGEPVDPEQEKADMRDAALLEGLSEEEAAAMMDEEDPDDPTDPDGFTDGQD